MSIDLRVNEVLALPERRYEDDCLDPSRNHWGWAASAGPPEFTRWTVSMVASPAPDGCESPSTPRAVNSAKSAPKYKRCMLRILHSAAGPPHG